MSRVDPTLRLLQRYESRNVTFIDPDGSWPIVWERAQGVHVWGDDGKKYLDLTAAFGVAAAGHANPRVIRAAQRQMARLLHGMGDVHPHALKAKLARELSRITFERWSKNARVNRTTSSVFGKVIFGNSGFEAVEAALKTAMLATGKSRVIAFSGAYHGLGYGALTATHRQHFRSPFRRQLREFAEFVDFPETETDLRLVSEQIERICKRNSIGAVLVEPIQGRAGIRIPPAGFLPLLRKLCDEHGALLIFDEIFTGFGRTGKCFACEHSQTTPDLICLGKALTGGFPLSACVGRADLMDTAWPAATGEAIHTSTFLGHPVGCAMALAQIAEFRSRKLAARSERLGVHALGWLEEIASQHGSRARGSGLMLGLELLTRAGQADSTRALRIVKKMLQSGFIILPEGEHANVISFTPPLTITAGQLRLAIAALARLMRETAQA
ncbi:MAG: aspartate aminotransferase family protein [Verrucomicrobia bacterium]|nr:aspartate aminotransferase family protein [Verrucomicrobiota bacterium]